LPRTFNSNLLIGVGDQPTRGSPLFGVIVRTTQFDRPHLSGEVSTNIWKRLLPYTLSESLTARCDEILDSNSELASALREYDDDIETGIKNLTESYLPKLLCAARSHLSHHRPSEHSARSEDDNGD
jgi:hypothetical protein